MALRVSTDFDGGRLGEILAVSDDLILADLDREWDHEHRCTQATWYYFRVDGCPGPFGVLLRGLFDVYDGRPSHSIRAEDLPAISHDGRTWTRGVPARFNAEAGTLAIAVEPRGESVWIAHLEPYVQEHLDRLATDLAAAGARLDVIGASVGGRPIPVWTIGDVGAPREAWVMARQHAWETHTSFCLEGLARWLVAGDGARLTERCQVHLLPWMDPDGCRRGGTRFNAHGWDVNRHWDATDPDDAEHGRLRPEIAAAKRWMRARRSAGRDVDLFLNLHDTQIDVMHPAPGPGDLPILRALHAELTAGHFAGRYETRPLGGGGAVQTAIFAELGIPSALIELGTIPQPTYGHLPSAAERVDFGAELGRAIDAVIPR